MLTNKELKTISKIIDLLNTIEINTSYDTNNELEITNDELLDYIEELNNIYTKEKIQKAKQSAKANAWNKAHPERHREINKLYERRKKLKGVK